MQDDERFVINDYIENDSLSENILFPSATDMVKSHTDFEITEEGIKDKKRNNIIK